MLTENKTSNHSKISRLGFIFLLILLPVALAFLFRNYFPVTNIGFSNDGPLGVQNAQAFAMPDAFQGIWLDMYWIGVRGDYAPANLTYLLLWLLGPLGYSKFSEPIALLFLGFSAWMFFRSLGLNPVLCAVASIAAALNGNFFSNATWGLGTRAISLGFIFLALAALNARHVGNKWINAALAGLAVGLSVVEGADNGIIFSLYVAAFVAFQALAEGRSVGDKITRGFRLVLVTAFALFIATQSLIGLLKLAEKNAVTAQADVETKEQKWSFATQWSLPPAETWRVLIPGLYGYRMNAPDGREERMYWGRVGESPGAPEAMRRFNGSGEYAGVLVILLALWTVAASFSKSLKVFSDKERKYIWFWAGAVVVSILLAWGRFAPFYQIIYALPYFSSVRNPMKFMHPAHMGLMILFGYGLLGLCRRYLETVTTNASAGTQFKAWWAKAVPFEKRWTWALIAATVLTALVFMFYSAARVNLEKHLTEIGFPDIGATAGLAAKIAKYSIGEVGTFAVWLALSGTALLLIMCGYFSGRKAVWAAALLGSLITVDLYRANTPWVVFWNYPYKYASNRIIDILKEKPYEARVVSPSYLMDGRIASYGGYSQYFSSLYSIEWVQHHFPYNSIQTLDVAQDPRPPADKEMYMKNVARSPGRYWQLTNTRYILGMSAAIDALNAQLDPGKNRFRIANTFIVDAKPGVQPKQLEDMTVVTVSNGPLALFEFTGALPRVKLFSKWLISTNDEATLATLVDPAFDPLESVIISGPVPESTAVTNMSGTAEIVRYKPQRIEIRANAVEPSVLLLNDRFDPDWRVSVDGKPAELLRGNFIMRAVQLPSGEHTVVFSFEPSLKGLKISLVAIALGFAFCGLLFFVRQEPVTSSDPPAKPAGKPHRG
jgi:hypothetical protein